MKRFAAGLLMGIGVLLAGQAQAGQMDAEETKTDSAWVDVTTFPDIVELTEGNLDDTVTEPLPEVIEEKPADTGEVTEPAPEETPLPEERPLPEETPLPEEVKR